MKRIELGEVVISVNTPDGSRVINNKVSALIWEWIRSTPGESGRLNMGELADRLDLMKLFQAAVDSDAKFIDLVPSLYTVLKNVISKVTVPFADEGFLTALKNVTEAKDAPAPVAETAPTAASA